jgi:hypothetical protein
MSEEEIKEEAAVELSEGTVLVDHVVTEEDLVVNPVLAEEGIAVGETIQIPVPEEFAEAMTEPVSDEPAAE